MPARRMTAPPSRGSQPPSPPAEPAIWITASGTRPAAAQTTMYPRMNATVGRLPSPRDRTTRAWASTIGTVAGNIMATIITTQIAKKSPAPSMAMPLMPLIEAACRAVNTQPAAAQARSTAMIAVATGRGSELTAADSRRLISGALVSAGPVERRRESTFPGVLKLHAESLAFRIDRLRDSDGGVGGVRHPGELGGLPTLGCCVVLDLDRYRVADPNTVPVAVVDVVDRQSLDPEDFTDQRRDVRHGTPHLAGEASRQLVGLLFGRLVVNDHADPPPAVQHSLGRVGDDRDAPATDIGTIDLAELDAVREN